MADASQIPMIAEPMFQQGNATVTLTPCMTLEDVKLGIEEATAQIKAMQGQSVQLRSRGRPGAQNFFA
jgi:hypothetical protein